MMKSRNTYLKLMLMTAGWLFVAGLYAAEEGMEEEGMEEEGMLEEEVEELPPLYTSEIEFGVGYSSQDSFKFGEYSGHDDDGAFAIGNIFFRKNAVIGDDDNDYWELSGSNLGLDSRNVYGEYSHDGTYGEYSKNPAYSFFLEYDQIPHNRFGNGEAETPMIGAGTSSQTLPAAWNDADIPGSLATTLRSFDVETERQKLGGGFSWRPLDGWKITGNYHHEFKDGTEPVAALLPGRNDSIILAAPIDYNVDEFDLRIAWADEKGQLDLAYHLSLFDNEDDKLRWQSPFDAARFGQNGTAPDNQSQQISLSGGYNLSQITRITGSFSYSSMEQDENFLPYSINPGFDPTAIPLPRTDLDGQVDHWFATAAIAGRPMPKLNLTGRYTYDYRDNRTPRNTYQYVQYDNTSQHALDGSRARVNRPYSHEKHKVELNASYQLKPRAKLNTGFKYENIDRNPNDIFLANTTLFGFDLSDIELNEVDETDEYTGHIKLLGSPTDNSQGWIKYLHSERDADSYSTPAPLLAGHTAQFLAGEAFEDLFENNYFLRKYNQADRSRDRIAGNLSFFPNNNLTLGISGAYTTDDYDDSVIGQTDRDTLHSTLDVTYIPKENISTYAFFTYEFINNEQDSFQYRSRAPCILAPPNPMVPSAAGGTCLDTQDFWNADTEDTVKTFGTGLTWSLSERLDVGLDYIYTDAETETGLQAGSFLTFDQLPDVNTTIHSLNLRGDYKLKDQLTMRFNYWYEYFDTDDFALDFLNEGTITDTVSLGESSPDYNTHVFGLSLIYQF